MVRSPSQPLPPPPRGPRPVPLSTAESCVFALENCRAGVGNLIAISLLSPFWPCRPRAEIGRLFRRLAADRQWNSATCPGLAKFGVSEMLILLTKKQPVCYKKQARPHPRPTGAGILLSAAGLLPLGCSRLSHAALLRNGAVRIPVQLATIGTWLYLITRGSYPSPPAVRRSTAARVTSSRGGSRSRLSLGQTGRRRQSAATSRAARI